MTRLELHDLIMKAYIGAIKTKYPEEAEKVKQGFEKQRAIMEAEELLKGGNPND